MATFGLIEYSEASAEVRAVYDDIMATRQTDYINNFWKALAHDPATLRRTWESVKKIMFTEPIMDSRPQVIPPSSYGGTRHFSAAQFVYDQRDAFALVASVDGRFTIFSWSPCDQIVLAHRVDCLLI